MRPNIIAILVFALLVFAARAENQNIDGEQSHRLSRLLSASVVASGAPPTGTASGSLTGTYPSPTIAASGVVPGSYTNVSLTAGNDGRITAMSSGSPQPLPKFWMNPSMMFTATILAGAGSFQYETDANNLENYRIYKSSPGNGDSYSAGYACLDSGTYTAKLWWEKSTDRGDVDIILNTNVVAHFSGYAGGGLARYQLDTTNFVLTTPGTYQVKCTVNGKNASSSNYYFVPFKLIFTQ